MSIKDRLIQFVLRGKDELSPAARTSAEALDIVRVEAEQLGKALDSAKEARGLVKVIEDTRRAMSQAEQGLIDTEQRVSELREALNQNPEAAGLQQSLKDAEREASRTRRTLVSLTGALTDQETAAKAAGIDTNKLADEEVRLAAEVEGAKKALAANAEELKALQREQAAAARSTAEHTSRVDAARSALSDGAKRVLAFAAAYISLNAAFNLVRGGLNLVRDGIRAVIADGSDNEQALGQLEAALASTGNAAGLTAQQLLDMAADFKRSAMLTTEEILAGQTRLLSYTDIVASQFPAAMQIVIDQQQRLGISVEQSAEIVGRALQSPSEAIATLGRQGFKLEDGQKRLLKQLEATGRKAEAQAVIMDMLTEAYGGAAAAARMNTFAGLLKTVGDQFSDFAGRVADSGAFEFVRGKLQQLSDHLDAMANDGRLDRLAQSLSDAFVNGAEAVSKYVERLATVDFEGLAARAASMAAQIGPAIEQAVAAGQYATATLTTVWNTFAGTVNSAAAALVLAVQQTVGRMALAVGQLAEMLGSDDLRAKADSLYTFLGELSMGYAQQAKTDFGQVAGAWDFLNEKVKQKATEQAQVVKQAADDQFEHVVQRVTDMNNALAQIDAAQGAAQFKQLGDELYKAYQRGDLSQQQYAAGTAMVQAKLREIGGAASGMASAVGIAADSLKDLADVQRAISDAKTDRDITAITAALRRLYDDGVIGAAEYNAELTKLSARQKELTQALQRSRKAQDDKNKSDREAIVTSEQLRRESGKRMEAERQAGDEAMQDRRRGASEARRDMADMENFFGGVVTRAREPLAQLSEAALAAYDKLAGISTVDMSLDTSSLDATTESLHKATDALAEMQRAASTVGMSGLGRWQTQTQLQSQQLQVQYLQEKQALLSLMQSYEKGTLTTARFVAEASSARNNLRLLNDSDLRTLEGAIDSAKQRMESLGDSTRSTLDGLRMELLQLKGTEEEIEKARFASRRRDLQAQQAEARQSGDGSAVANLQAALRTLNEIERESSRKRAQDAQQKAAEQVTKAAPVPVQPQQPPKIIRLETTRGQSVEVGLQSDTDETRLLGILEGAGLRSRR